MKNKKKIRYIILTIALVVGLSGAVIGIAANRNQPATTIEVDYAYHYGSVAEIVAEADFAGIIQIDAQTQITGNGSVPQTAYTARVITAGKGAKDGETINLRIDGYKTRFKTVTTMQDLLPEIGEKFLLFARKSADGSYYYSVNGACQGRFGIKNGKITALVRGAEQDDIFYELQKIPADALTEYVRTIADPT